MPFFLNESAVRRIRDLQSIKFLENIFTMGKLISLLCFA